MTSTLLEPPAGKIDLSDEPKSQDQYVEPAPQQSFISMACSKISDVLRFSLRILDIFSKQPGETIEAKSEETLKQVDQSEKDEAIEILKPLDRNQFDSLDPDERDSIKAFVKHALISRIQEEQLPLLDDVTDEDDHLRLSRKLSTELIVPFQGRVGVLSESVMNQLVYGAFDSIKEQIEVDVRKEMAQHLTEISAGEGDLIDNTVAHCERRLAPDVLGAEPHNSWRLVVEEQVCRHLLSAAEDLLDSDAEK